MPVTVLQKETNRLRAVIQSPSHRLRITVHARDEMRNDDIIHADVVWVLRVGVVRWMEMKKDELWHVEGKDVDGRSIRLVVAVYDDEVLVKVVTAMKLRRQ
jgi:hypothetical protein